MKDLMEFARVKDVLEKVVAESDVDNGTKGMEFTAHFWEQNNIFNKQKNELLGKLGTAWMNGDVKSFEEDADKMNDIESTMKMLTWNIIPSIGLVYGTKQYKEDGKVYRLKMENISKLYISETAVRLKLIQFEETNEMALDAMGRETPILRMKLVKGLIDIAPPVSNWKGIEIVPKRAFVTAISYSALQIAGELKAEMNRRSKKRIGYDIES